MSWNTIIVSDHRFVYVFSIALCKQGLQRSNHFALSIRLIWSHLLSELPLTIMYAMCMAMVRLHTEDLQVHVSIKCHV